jgi:ABC-type Fe3+/spermidine/putrescine transport system ATPase subunit
MADAYLQLTNLTKSFGDHTAIRDLSLDVEQGAVLALLGPSGSGKTTTLRLLAGFERPDRGAIIVEGRDITGQQPAERRFGMVFQHYALFPHLTVEQNVAFGLADRAPDERSGRVREVLAMVDLADFERREVTALSGGQQQRVAVARALAPEPRVMLLDEPLSNLDPGLRERTRRELRAALAQSGVTTVFVTHEQEEAFALADRVAVLHEGALEQVGTAPQLYEEPATQFVATFVGRASVVRGEALDGGRVRVAPGIVWAAQGVSPVAPDTRVAVVVRPEQLRFTDAGGLEGLVRERRYTGARAFFLVDTALGVLEVEAPVDVARAGDRVHVTADWARIYPERS